MSSFPALQQEWDPGLAQLTVLYPESGESVHWISCQVSTGFALQTGKAAAVLLATVISVVSWTTQLPRCSCKFPGQVVWKLYSAVNRVTNSLPCLGAVGKAASRLLNSLCELNSSQSMPQVPWLNRATGFALGAHALQWAGLTLALAWLEQEGPTSGNSKIF